jgi:hypothetical protein
MWFTLSCEVDASDSDIAKARRDPPFQEYAAQGGGRSRTEAVVVTLTGQVPTIGASATASEIARGVPGVKSVKNELTFTR